MTTATHIHTAFMLILISKLKSIRSQFHADINQVKLQGAMTARHHHTLPGFAMHQFYEQGIGQPHYYSVFLSSSELQYLKRTIFFFSYHMQHSSVSQVALR